MKKIVSLLAVLTLVCMASSVWAVPVTKKATATFNDDGPLTINVNLYEWTGNDKNFADYTPKTGEDADTIVFPTSGITPGSSNGQWSVSTTFAKVSTNLSAKGAGTTVYLYTNNQENPTATYQAKAANNGAYNGLIRAGNDSNYMIGDHAPIRIQFVKMSDTTGAVGTGDGFKPYASYRSTLPTFDGNKYYTQGFRYLTDRKDSGFASLGLQDKVLGISGLRGGIWIGKADDSSSGGVVTPGAQWYAGDEDVLIFFGAEFTKVVGGDTYATETITFGAETE